MKTSLLALLLRGASSRRPPVLIESTAVDVALASLRVRIEPFGANSLRVRARADGQDINDSLPGALLLASSDVATSGRAGDVVRNGNIEASVDEQGLVTVTRVSDKQVILREVVHRTEDVDGPQSPVSNVAFASTADEGLFGFGEHQQGHLNNKGLSYDMESCLDYGKSWGGEVCLPFILGTSKQSVEYGFLWNMPNYGGVDFAETLSNWTAYQAPQTDYFVSTYAEKSQGGQRAGDVMKSYVDAVGHAPMLPEYAAGYWHSKNRYESQAELLEAAEGFHNRSIPVDIIVIDYHHWSVMGDWSFDESLWPDVDGMVKQLSEWGMRVMASAWPFTAQNSTSFHDVQEKNLAVADASGKSPVWWNDSQCGMGCFLLDQSKKETRDYFWSRLDQGYFQHNISIFWLDAAEPEIETTDARTAAFTAQYSQGSAYATGMMFPYWHTQAVHDGLVSAGREDGDIIMLTRSAWAGMQRFGAALWSGDTQSTWDSLKVSLAAGLNTQMSGIAWWTTDIGGYNNGHSDDPNFRELVVRWFQYGAACPLFRQHGVRDTTIWAYGDEAYQAILKVMKWRQENKEYVLEQMKVVSETGTPVNRPLWWDFPEDARTWQETQSFMFGPKYLVAPITEANATSWSTYLPAGAKWQYHFDASKTWEGGQEVTVPTPLDEFPLFVRVASEQLVI